VTARLRSGEFWVRVALALYAAYLGWLFLRWALRHDQVDFGVYRAGGAALLHGRDLYKLRVPPVYLPFTYPPAAAALFVAFSAVSVRTGQFLWAAVAIVGLWFFVRLTLRRYAAGFASTSVLVTLVLFIFVARSNPLRLGMQLGQINVVIGLLIVADLCGVLPRVPRGCMIGVAAALKLTPAFLVAYFLAVRRFREAANAAATFVAISVAAFVVAPHASRNYWLDGYFADARRTGRISYISNQSLNGVLIRVVHSSVHAKPWWLLAAVAVAAFVLVCVRRIEPDRPWLAEALAMATMLLVSPVSWIHHWILVLPFLVAGTRLCLEAAGRARFVLFAAIGLLSVLLYEGVAFKVPHNHNLEYHHTVVQFFVGNADVLVLLGVVAGAAILALRQPSALRNLAASGAAT